MESFLVTPDGKVQIYIDLTVDEEPQQALKRRKGPKPVNSPKILNLVEWADGQGEVEWIPSAQPDPVSFDDEVEVVVVPEEAIEPEIPIIDPLVVRYPKRTYLHVPFMMKDDAKSFGAKWDVVRKRWYVYKANPFHDTLTQKYSL